ncbi:MAG: DUF401 family protein [Firmicutes bacterium]|nr:DUF401 family protein [Bacillota bacterium]
MQLFPELPWLIKILLSLGAILLTNRLFKSLSLAMASGSLLIALFAGQSPAEMLAITSSSLLTFKHLTLVLTIALIYWLSVQMSETGLMHELVDLIQSRLSTRGSISALPTVIGVLPIPGGAFFSAPLVDNCDQEKHFDPELKSAINYWFRHTWEFWSPLFPGSLLAMEITGLSSLEFLLAGFPLSLIAAGAGYLLLLREIPTCQQSTTGGQTGFWRRLIFLQSPLIIVIGTYIVYQLLPAIIGKNNQYIPIGIGISGAVLWLQYFRPLTAAQWRKILIDRKILVLMVQISVIQVYAAFIGSNLPDGTPLVARISSELTSLGIPIVLMIMLVPFVSALATGAGIGYVGASFPMVISLLGAEPSFGALFSAVVLAQGFGMTGMLLSPVHICLLVSNEYFKTELTPTLAKLFKPGLSVLVGTVLFYLLYSYLF